MAKKILGIAILGVLLALTTPVAVFAQDFTGGTVIAQGVNTYTVTITGHNPHTGQTITRSYSFDINFGRLGAGGAAQARAQARAQATHRFERENPGFQIRNVQSR